MPFGPILKGHRSPDVASRPLTSALAAGFRHDDPLPLEPPEATVVLFAITLPVAAQRKKQKSKCRRVQGRACVSHALPDFLRVALYPPAHALTLGNTPNSWKSELERKMGLQIYLLCCGLICLSWPYWIIGLDNPVEN